MKRNHWISLLLGLVITFVIASAYSRWGQTNTTVAPLPLNANEIAFRNLPPEAKNVIARIKAHGRFEFEQDGTTFQNRERLLPAKPRGYYQEYTVITPNATNRGARRIVAGKGNTGDVATAGEFYYTADHYQHFYRVKE